MDDFERPFPSRAMAEPSKARIDRVGYVIVFDDDESTILVQWSFDCLGVVKPFAFGEDGENLIAGYTLDELGIISNEHHVDVPPGVMEEAARMVYGQSEVTSTALDQPKGVRGAAGFWTGLWTGLWAGLSRLAGL